MTLITVLAFFFIIEIGETFGSTGKISPILGGWLGNIVFSIVAVFLLRRVRV
jgi:lipopolysaccharide export LptBFGC system permease protein LptF